MTSVISLFSGCGGSSLGYHQSGYDVRLAVEWDKHAAQTYATNFPDTPLYHGDITQLDIETAQSLSGLQDQELDVLDGSPPCQGFSKAGKQDLFDPRNQMYHDYVRFLQGFQPKMFVLENVKGLIQGKNKIIFVDMMDRLRGAGYRVSARILNSWWYGVPQSRQRLIVIGTRNDLEIKPSHPEPIRSTPMTVGQALKDCPDDHIEYFDSKGAEVWDRIHVGGSLDDLFTTINPVTKKEVKSRRMLSMRKVNPHKPFPTMPKITGNHYQSDNFCHWKEPRLFTIAEAKRLQGFPDDFKLPNKFVKAWGLLGNSVPPPLMKSVGSHVKQLIESL